MATIPRSSEKPSKLCVLCIDGRIVKWLEYLTMELEVPGSILGRGRYMYK